MSLIYLLCVIWYNTVICLMYCFLLQWLICCRCSLTRSHKWDYELVTLHTWDHNEWLCSTHQLETLVHSFLMEDTCPFHETYPWRGLPRMAMVDSSAHFRIVPSSVRNHHPPVGRKSDNKRRSQAPAPIRRWLHLGAPWEEDRGSYRNLGSQSKSCPELCTSLICSHLGCQTGTRHEK